MTYYEYKFWKKYIGKYKRKLKFIIWNEFIKVIQNENGPFNA